MQPVGNKLDRFFIPLNDRFVNPSENNPSDNHNERSLCQGRFRGQHFTIGYLHRQKRNENPAGAGRQYPAFWLPYNC
jgi:hypothetical protein